MKVELLCAASLAVGQSRKLLGVSKDKFDLESGTVSLVELIRVDGDIGGEQQRVAQLFRMFMID